MITTPATYLNEALSQTLCLSLSSLQLQQDSFNQTVSAHWLCPLIFLALVYVAESDKRKQDDLFFFYKLGLSVKNGLC